MLQMQLFKNCTISKVTVRVTEILRFIILVVFIILCLHVVATHVIIAIIVHCYLWFYDIIKMKISGAVEENCTTSQISVRVAKIIHCYLWFYDIIKMKNSGAVEENYTTSQISVRVAEITKFVTLIVFIRASLFICSCHSYNHCCCCPLLDIMALSTDLQEL